MPLVALVVLVAAGVVLVVLWRWIDSLALANPVDKDRATAQLDAVKVAASIAVGGGGLFALYLGARRQRTQELELDQRERVQDDIRHDSDARRVTELYAKASEQLGSDKAPVRLAGLYAMERLAQDNPGQRQTVVNVLCAYLRMPYALPGEPPADDDARARHETQVQEREVRLTAQRILSGHLRPVNDDGTPAGTFWPDIDLDLTGATLVDFGLDRCRMRHATFESATFSGKLVMSRALFTQSAIFRGATFTETAEFTGTEFLNYAAFSRANFLKRAFFNDAKVYLACDFAGATFAQHADFQGAVLEIAIFDMATFAGAAWFDATVFLSEAMFRYTTFAGLTRFHAASFRGDFTFNRALVVHPLPLHSSLPPAWRPSEDYFALDGRDGTWHRLVPSDPPPEDR